MVLCYQLIYVLFTPMYSCTAINSHAPRYQTFDPFYVLYKQELLFVAIMHITVTLNKTKTTKTYTTVKLNIKALYTTKVWSKTYANKYNIQKEKHGAYGKKKLSQDTYKA